MNNNHNHTEDVLVNTLAGTVPQARPEFQQVLEDQLMLTLQERMEMKPMSIDRERKPKRIPRGLPVSLAATVAMILFGGLAALVTSGSLNNARMFTGAAQSQPESIPADMALTATAIIAQATEQAAAANPDQAMTSVVQTATAVVQQATQRASGGNMQPALSPSLVPTATPIGSVFASVVPQSCSPDKLVVYTAPGVYNPVLTSIDPLHTDKYQIQGILTLHETGEDWFFVSFAYAGEAVEGWIQADTVRAACENVSLLPPTVVPPAVLFAPVCAPDSLAYYEAPGEDTAAAGRVQRLDILDYRIEASVMIDNTANEWVLVQFALASGENVRGWVRALELSPACQPTAVPGLATPTPIPAVLATAVPICPAQQLLLYAEPSQSAGIVGDLPFDPTLHIEGMLTLNRGDSWLLVVLQGVRGWLPEQALPKECVRVLAPAGVPVLDKMAVSTFPLDASPAPTMLPAFTPTATPFASAPEVEQMDDGTYQITLSIAEEPVAEIEPDDLVYVLAEMRYGMDGRAWTVVAQDMQVIALIEPAAAAGSSFYWMDVVLSSSDEETVSLLQDMAAAGVAFSLERIP